jgi:hypothetical protein
LIGAITLSLCTLLKFLAAVFGEESINWSELFSFFGIVFALGFLCGVCVALLLPLVRYGAVGLAAIGLVSMNFFFLCCIYLFAPELLVPDPARAAPMFIMASLLGPFAGIFIGRGVLQSIAETQEETRKKAENDVRGFE